MKAIEPKPLDYSSHPRVHAGPEPRRTKVKAISRRFAGCVNGQDTTPKTLTGLKELKIDFRLLQKNCCVEARKASSDNRHCSSHQSVLFQLPFEIAVSCASLPKLTHIHQYIVYNVIVMELEISTRLL